MGGRHQIQTGGSSIDQLPKNLPQALRRNGLAYGSLRNGTVLAETAPQIAAGEKDRSRAVLAHQARLLPQVQHGLGGHRHGRLMANAAAFCLRSFRPAAARAQITNHNFEQSLAIAEAISDFAYDTLYALKNCARKKEEALKLFCDNAMQTPAVCVNKVLLLEKEIFDEFSGMLIPLICSRQFSFQIYSKMRSCVVTKGQIKFSDQFEKIAVYLDRKGYKDAIAVYDYLCALHACMTENREALGNILREHDILTDIPEQWKNEAQRILQYAKIPNQEHFVPDKTILDSSEKSNHEKITYQFVKKLVPVFEVKKMIEFM